nr:MAG TPA: hypothetical protein [Caudoviricetes sp.]
MLISIGNKAKLSENLAYCQNILTIITYSK